MKRTIALWVGLALSIPGFAQKSGADHSAHHSGAAPQSATLTEGEVRKVDKDAKKITLKHGPIKNVDMPAMTMVFKVKNPGLLEGVKAGDRIGFAVEKTGDDYLVTHIEPKK